MVGAVTADAGVPAAEELLALTEAAVRGEALDGPRAAVVAAVGSAGAGQAVATIAAFSGLVRVADGTGIPVDHGLAAASVSLRDQLQLDSFGGAANTSLSGVAAAEFADVDTLF